MTTSEKNKPFQRILSPQTLLIPSQSGQKKYESFLKSFKKKFQSTIGEAVDFRRANLEVLADPETQERPKCISGHMVFFMPAFDTLSKSLAIKITHRSAHLFASCHKKRKGEFLDRYLISSARIDC